MPEQGWLSSGGLIDDQDPGEYFALILLVDRDLGRSVPCFRDIGGKRGAEGFGGRNQSRPWCDEAAGNGPSGFGGVRRQVRCRPLQLGDSCRDSCLYGAMIPVLLVVAAGSGTLPR